MSVESAEMTKHAVNAFLATSVVFINELASLCEQTGADAKEVERGLKTESRIGPRAYLGPGAAFAGGTLARDVVFLRTLGERVERPTPLMDGVEASNRAHRGWAQRRLQAELGTLAGRTVAVWGLTYKPGTDTLRRSTALATFPRSRMRPMPRPWPRRPGRTRTSVPSRLLVPSPTMATASP
jgi:UDPglucose 6-dehydrogenase